MTVSEFIHHLSDECSGGGVFSLDGRMVDALVLLLAQRTLARAAVRSSAH
jgi:citrate lyase beta subunit